MDRLVAGNCAPSAPKRTKMLACAHPAFDGPVILFQDVVEILHRSMSAVLLQSTLSFELHYRRRITGVLVGVDDPRRRMVLSAQSLGEKALGRRCIAFSREKEVDRRTGRVDSPVQIDPLALNPDVGLIHLPTVVGRSEPRSQSALNFWGVTVHPPPDGDVVDRKSALGKEFLHVAVGQRELQIPANRQQDDLRFELPPLEKTRNRRREQEHRTSLSDHASKVATLPASVTKAPSITAKPPSISTRTVDH